MEVIVSKPFTTMDWLRQLVEGTEFTVEEILREFETPTYRIGHWTVNTLGNIRRFVEAGK